MAPQIPLCARRRVPCEQQRSRLTGSCFGLACHHEHKSGISSLFSQAQVWWVVCIFYDWVTFVFGRRQLMSPMGQRTQGEVSTHCSCLGILICLAFSNLIRVGSAVCCCACPHHTCMDSRSYMGTFACPCSCASLHLSQGDCHVSFGAHISREP